MRRSLLPSFLALLSLFATVPSVAQRLEHQAAEDTDPLGLGDTLSLAQVPIEPAPPARPPAPRAGEVVGAAPAVREVEHRTHVSWRALTARGEELWRFRNTGSFPAELRYRHALPQAARLASFSVCIAERCREGSIRDETGSTLYDEALGRMATLDEAPVGLANVVDDSRGHAVVVRAAAVPARGELTVHLEWMVDAPLVGGSMHLTLPARGTDPRAAPAWITAEAEGLSRPVVEGGPGDRPAQVEPWFAAEVEAHAERRASNGTTAQSRRCEAGRCLTLRAWAPPRRARARDVVLMLDVSPSVSWPRTLAALTSVLTSAPAWSRFILVAFGARAQLISNRWQAADEVPVTALSTARDAGLGPATRFDRAVEAARPLIFGRGSRPEIVLVSDGRLTDPESTAAVFWELAAHRVRVSLLNVGDEDAAGITAQIADTRGRVIPVGEAADAASRGRETSDLDRRVRGLFAPRVGVLRGRVGATEAQLTLYAGDSATLRVDGHGHPSARLGDTAIRVERMHGAQATVLRLEAATVDAGSRVTGYTMALAPPEPAPPSSAPALGRGVPAQTVLSMLRTRLIPPARACFRRDRAGREDYALRAEFRFRLQDREVVEASITGELPDGLRRCLLDTLFTLEVPSFRGAVIVTYPLHTVRVGPSMTIELLPEVASDVDQVVSDTRDEEPGSNGGSDTVGR